MDSLLIINGGWGDTCRCIVRDKEYMEYMGSIREFLLEITDYYLGLGFKWVLIAGAVAAIGIVFLAGRIEKGKVIAAGLLVFYCMLVLSYTVLGRTGTGEYCYVLEPFWSYQMILEGQTGFIMEALLNVLMLVPVGFLISILKKSFWLAAGCGFMFSVLIEVLQLVTTRGLCETDDVLHNTLGAIAGYLAYRVIKWLTS